MKKSIIALASCLLFATVLSSCGAKSNAEKMTFVLDWTPNTNHTGLYVALEKGYYSEEGIELEIVSPPEDGASALVASGKADFGVSFQESLAPALSTSNPLPITCIASMIQHNDSGIVSLKSSGIERPAELSGKRFATWGTPLVDAIMTNVVDGDGGDYSSVKLVYNNVSDIITALQTEVDAVWIYYSWDGIALENAGIETNYFAFADINPIFDFYTPILITNNDRIKNDPESVQKFLDATKKGYEFAINNPEEAAEILLKYAPELDAEMVRKSQAYLSPRYQDDAPYWGYIDAERWNNFNNWMYEQGLLEHPIEVESYNSEFINQAK